MKCKRGGGGGLVVFLFDLKMAPKNEFETGEWTLKRIGGRFGWAMLCKVKDGLWPLVYKETGYHYLFQEDVSSQTKSVKKNDVIL